MGWGYPKKHAHGVKNHGSTFLQKLTLHQEEQIAKLRTLDFVLYNISRAVFDEQVRDMEANYNFKLCDQWNPIMPTDRPTPIQFQ